MEIEIPIKGGSYKYIIDNISKNYIEDIEIKYNILQDFYKNKDKKNLNEKDKKFYINYLFTIFDYLDYDFNKPDKFNINKLIQHLEICYTTDDFEFNKQRLLKQLGFDKMVKDILIYLLNKLKINNVDNLSNKKLKTKLINKLNTIENQNINWNINIVYIDNIYYKKQITNLKKNTKITLIDEIDDDIILYLDKLIYYIINLNNIYKNYIINIEKNKLNIIKELYNINL